MSGNCYYCGGHPDETVDLRRLRDELEAEIERLRGELARSSEQAAHGWQPIETAPRDGRMALVYRPLALKSGDEPVAVKRLVKGNQFCWDSTVPPGAKPFNPTDGACHVTHWMPIPEPPSAAVVSGSTEGGK